MATALAALLAALQLVTARPVAAQPRPDQGLEGSWRIDLVFDDPPGATNMFLGTFGPGGIYVQSAGLYSQGRHASGHGAWQRVGEQFALTILSFGWDNEGEPFVSQVWATITLSDGGSRFTAPFRVAFVRPDGTVLGTGAGTARGTRIAVEPL